MFYFQHHIGDYRRDTGHLTLLEHGIYRQLIDLYYITEKPLDASAMRLVCVRTADEEQAYKRVLADFFHERKGKYFHKRCDFEISKYKDKSSKATDSAKTRWNKIKDLPDANALQTHCDDDADGMLTKEPINLTTKEPKNLQTKEPKNLTKERSKEEGAPRSTRFEACPFPDKWKTFCQQERPELDALNTFEQFSDYWAGVPGTKGKKLDWNATWRVWVRNQKVANKTLKSKTSNNDDNFEKARQLIFGATTEKDISDESERV